MEQIIKALGEYGQKEIAGVENNSEILKYSSEIGQKWVTNDEVPWCAAYVNWIIKKIGKIGTNKLTSRSFLDYGTPTLTPEIGDIVVLGAIDNEKEYGHVGFFIKKTDNIVYILGGNQSDQVNITAFNIRRVLSYRKLPILPIIKT